MNSSRSWFRLGDIGLIILGLIALALSVAALLQNHPTRAVPATTPAPTVVSASPSTVRPPASASRTQTASKTTARLSAVIVGDSYSMGEPAQIWVGPVASRLGWAPVINLSAPGRGYVTTPRSCDNSPCAPFGGVVAAVASSRPAVVVTFGGVADSDSDIGQSASGYFKSLRQALPSAKLIALSPITTNDAAPSWFTRYKQEIRAAVEAVGGTFIDVGQPGLGDGNVLSAEAHAVIARQVIAELT